MKKWLISLCILLSVSPLCSWADANGYEDIPSTKYHRNTERYNDAWEALIPNQTTIQFAGSIGMFSVGIGWHYGKRDRWETELLLGFVPKYNSEAAKPTFTVKERFTPWNIDLSSRWSIEPLSTGLFVNSIFGEGFWRREPSRYTKGYYGFATKMRFHIFLGQRIRYRIPSRIRRYNKSVALYYEISTCDLYAISAFTNKQIGFADILSLGLGLRFEIF